MRQFKKGKASSFDEVMEDLAEKNKKARAEFEAKGGICLHCGKSPAIGFKDNPTQNPFQCKACNAKTEKILAALGGCKHASRSG